MPLTISDVYVLWLATNAQHSPILIESHQQHQGGMSERDDFLRKMMKMSKHFDEKGVNNVTTLHLSFGYPEQRLQWVQGNACQKAIYCRCACALRMWVSMFFHTALSD